MVDCSMVLIDNKEKILNNAISKVQNGMNIIYSNCISHIKIDKTTLKTNKYNTLLYNEENNIAIILQRDGKIQKQELIDKIPSESLCEVEFNPIHPWNIKTDYAPELLFCDNDENLEIAIQSLIDEGEDRCYYYTDVNFLFQIGYIDKRGYPSVIMEKHGEGMIQFNNKLIFLDINYDKNNIPAWEIIEKYGIKLRLRDELKYKTKKRVKNFKI